MGIAADRINFEDKFNLFNDQWAPKVIAELNDYQFKLVKIQGEFIWHKHEDTDEAFIVVEGDLTISLKDDSREVHLSQGEMFVVPKGTEHKPMSENEAKVLIIEPRGILNTGNQTSKHTSENDVWV